MLYPSRTDALISGMIVWTSELDHLNKLKPYQDVAIER
jgi:hypothetical protein